MPLTSMTSRALTTRGAQRLMLGVAAVMLPLFIWTCSADKVVGPKPATQLAFTVAPSTATGGAIIAPAVKVEARDASGGLVTNYSGSITVALAANPGSGTLGGTKTVAASGGVATFSDLTVDKLGTGYTLQASAGTLTAATSAAFNILPGPAAKLAFTVQPGTPLVAGSTLTTITVTAQDLGGNTSSGFTNNILVAITAGSGTAGATLSGTTTASATAGVATFSTLSVDKSGTGYTLSASSSGLTTGISTTFTVAAGPAAQLAFTTQPSTTVAGAAITPAVKVAVQDALGNTVTTFAGNLTIAITAGTGTAGALLSGTANVATVGGVATFTGLSIDKSGRTSAGTGYTLSASGGALTAATSDPFDISVGAPTQLAFQAAPSTAAAGAGFAPLVEVAVLDAAGNTVTSFNGNVTVAIGTNPSGGTLAGTATVGAVAGVATFSTVHIDQVGSGYTLSASATTLTGVTSSPFDITPGPAAELVFSVQPVATSDSAPITPAVKVTARDAFGNIATQFAGNVTVTIGTNPGAGTLSGNKTLAATNGVATFSDLSINNIGVGYTLAASAADLTGITSDPFDIIASAASKLAFSIQPSTAIAGATMATITVSARDAANQPVAGFKGGVTLRITAGSGAAGAALSGDTTIVAAGGIATFSNLSIDSSAGNYTLTAIAGGLTSAVSATFAVAAGPAASLAFAVAPSTVTADSVIRPQIEVVAHDALGNVADGFSGDVTLAIAFNPNTGSLAGTTTVAAVAGVAAFANVSIDKAGNGYTLSASATGPSGTTSAPFDVTAAQASHLVFTVEPASTTAGSGLAPAIQVTAKDGSGNVVTGFTGDVTLSITAGTGAGGATLSGTSTQTAVAGVATFSNLSIDRSGTGYTLSSTGPGLTGSTSTAFDIAAGTLTKLAFTTQPSGAVAGSPLTTTVTGQDALGNTVPSFTGSVAVTIGANPAGGALSGAAAVNAVAGVATFSTLAIDKSGVGYTLSASSGALTGATSAPFDITAGTAVGLAFTVQPSTTLAGAAIAPTILVTAQDAFGNTATTFNGSVTLAIATNPGGGVLAGTAVNNAVAGVASFSTLSINKSALGYALSASAGGLGTTSALFDITPGAATVLAFTVQPTTATANANLAPAVKVTARDALGNTATGFNGNVTVNIGANPGSSALSGTRTLAAINGVASYQALSLNNTGTGYTLTAAAGGLTGTTSTPFNIITSVGTQLFFTIQPSNAAAGAAIAPAIQVTARDASGQTAASYSGNVTVAITSGTGAAGAALSGPNSVAAASGIATFSNLAIDKSAVGYKLTATAAGLTSSTSAFFTITPGPASQLVFTLQPSTATVATAIAPKVEVTARDAHGNTATGFTDSVTIALASNPTGAVLGGTLKVAAAGGIASYSTLSLNLAGTGYTLSAASGALSGATSGTFDITATRATQLAFSVQPSAATAGTAIAPAVKVRALNASGQVDATFTGTVTLAISAGSGTAGATLSGATPVAAVAGVATFSNLSIDNSGTGYRLAATAAGVAGATSTPFTINAGAATRVNFIVQPGTTSSMAIIPGATGPTIQVTARDALGNPVRTFTGNMTITLSSNPGGGTLSGLTTVAASAGVATFNDLTIDKAASGYRFAVTAAGLAPDTSDAFSITAGAATQLLFTVQPTSVAASAAIAPAMRVTALDAQGNIATGFGGNVTLAIGTNPSGGVLSGVATVAAANGVATFSGLSITPAGIGYTLRATSAGLTQATSAAFNIN
jgi:hypothetical protein